MSDFTLTKTRLFEGVWEGVLRREVDSNVQPGILVAHLEQPIEGVEMTELSEPGRWAVRIPVPAHLISDGVQTFLIMDARSGDQLQSFSLISGEALGDDIRAEMDLLRAELDMLKRAFRRHCLETG